MGWGEGEGSRNFGRFFTPLPFIPSREGRGIFTCCEIHKVDGFTIPIMNHPESNLRDLANSPCRRQKKMGLWLVERE
jgi:hypothetical protein